MTYVETFIIYPIWCLIYGLCSVQISIPVDASLNLIQLPHDADDVICIAPGLRRRRFEFSPKLAIFFMAGTLSWAFENQFSPANLIYKYVEKTSQQLSLSRRLEKPI